MHAMFHRTSGLCGEGESSYGWPKEEVQSCMKVWGRSAPCTKRKQEPGDDHCARSSTRVTIAQEQRDGSTAGLVPEGRREEHAVALGLEDEGGFASSTEEHGFEGHPTLHIPTSHGR